MLIEAANVRLLPSPQSTGDWISCFLNDAVNNEFWRLRMIDQSAFVGYRELVLHQAVENVQADIPERLRNPLLEIFKTNTLVISTQRHQPDENLTAAVKNAYLGERLEREDPFWSPTAVFRYSATIQ